MPGISQSQCSGGGTGRRALIVGMRKPERDVGSTASRLSSSLGSLAAGVGAMAISRRRTTKTDGGGVRQDKAAAPSVPQVIVCTSFFGIFNGTVGVRTVPTALAAAENRRVCRHRFSLGSLDAMSVGKCRTKDCRMSEDEHFKPRLGRMRAKGGKRGRSYLHRVLAAANLARGGGAIGRSGRSFFGSRIGRGSGVGRMLASRDRYAAFRARRVIIKSRIVRLVGRGTAAAAAHLRYLRRDGTTREGAPGTLYGREGEAVDGKAFLDRGNGDRHQFRFIVSPEDGDQYDELKSLTRRLMARVEQDLGTRLDWVAVDHFNTGHPHTHIIVRGVDDQSHDLVIARDYLTVGMRERAAELVDLDLGPRDDLAIEARLRAEIDQERLTGIDRRLLAAIDDRLRVSATAAQPFDQSLRAGRLAKLARMGLAEPAGHGHWTLDEHLEQTLRRMGERGDIIRTMQRAFAIRGAGPAAADQMIYDPRATDAPRLVGRVVERGLSDELLDRHYLIVEATDGRTHYVDIGGGEAIEPLAAGAVIEVAAVETAPRRVDRTIAEVAAKNGGRYDVDVHLRHDPLTREAFAQTHVRRLEALRRHGGGATRNADGSWTIAPDHLARVEAVEQARARERPVKVTLLSAQSVERQVAIDAPTWLDHEIVAAAPEPLRDAGFGAAARQAQTRRMQWLITEGLATGHDGNFSAAPGLIATLQRRELLRVAGQLSAELNLDFIETSRGGQIDGVLRRSVDTASGRYALIVKSKEFTLVPWRPVLDRHIGKQVSGLMRGSGVNWTVGRSRSGPSIG